MHKPRQLLDCSDLQALRDVLGVSAETLATNIRLQVSAQTIRNYEHANLCTPQYLDCLLRLIEAVHAGDVVLAKPTRKSRRKRRIYRWPMNSRRPTSLDNPPAEVGAEWIVQTDTPGRWAHFTRLPAGLPRLLGYQTFAVQQ